MPEFAETVGINGRGGKLKSTGVDGSFGEAENFGGGRVIDFFSFGESLGLALGSITNVERVQGTEVRFDSEAVGRRGGEAFAGFHRK